MFSSPNGLCFALATGYRVNAYCNCLLARSLHNQDYVKLPEKLLLICAVHILKRFQPYAKSKFHFLFEKWANYDRYIVANGGARLIARYHRGGFSSALKTLENIMSARPIVSQWRIQNIIEAREDIHTLCLNSQTPFIDKSCWNYVEIDENLGEEQGSQQSICM